MMDEINTSTALDTSTPAIAERFSRSSVRRIAANNFRHVKLGRFLGAGSYGFVYCDRNDPSKCIKLFMIITELEQKTASVFDRLIVEKPWWAARMYDYGFSPSSQGTTTLKFDQQTRKYVNYVTNASFCYYRVEKLHNLTHKQSLLVGPWLETLEQRYGVRGRDFGPHNTMVNFAGELKVIDFDHGLEWPRQNSSPEEQHPDRTGVGL